MEAYTAMSEAMAAQAARYPLMEAQDWYKLVYQGEFGAGHLIADIEAARMRFMDEWGKAGPVSPGELLEEPIGGGFCRLHLRPAKGSGAPPEAIFSAFLSGAAITCGSAEGMRKKLRTLEEFLDDGRMKCTSDELRAFIKGYEGRGYPMVSHSECYRSEYRPSYRIIRAGDLHL